MRRKWAIFVMLSACMVILCGMVQPAALQAQSGAAAQAGAAAAQDDPVRTLVSRLDIEKYKATIKALTQFGGLIKTRLGLHEIGQGRCSSKNGLVLLELVGPGAKCKQLAAKLAAIEGIEVQQMVFKH